MDLLIKGDIVLDHGVSQKGAIAVKDGIITAVFAPGADLPPAGETIDASGMLIFPGVVDAHVHSYCSLVEGLENATRAAAAGGVTTMVEMPYDAMGPPMTPEKFQGKIDLVREKVVIDTALLATLPKKATPDMIEPLAALGACGFKLSIFETDPVRFPRIDDDILWDVFPSIKASGLVVGFHAENDVIIEALIRRYKEEGKTYPRAHCETRPPVSESLAVAKVLELAHWTGTSIHIYHASHPRCLELVRWYRGQGVDVSVETCPHYLLLNEDDMDRIGAFGKINPPLRSRQASQDLWQNLKDDMFDMITSDHAPWLKERKIHPKIFDNSSGGPGVETLLPLMYSEAVVKRGLKPEALARLLASGPAERFKLAPRKGRITPGADGDLAILDPSETWTIRGEDNLSTAKWSPFEGMRVKGRVRRTIVRGQTVYADGRITAQPGQGQFVPARTQSRNR